MNQNESLSKPKSDIKASADAITTLCHLTTTSKDFQADTNAFAAKVGLSNGKNVPRKINSIINEYGFEMKGGVIVEKGNSGQTSTPAPSPSTPSKKKKTGGTTVAGPDVQAVAVTKKRKLEVVSA